MRSFTSRLVCLALVVPTAVVAGLTTTPASAAAGDVLSAEWNTQLTSGTLLSQSADVTAYPPSSTTAASGAVFTMPGSQKKVTVAPPTGTRFSTGTTYTATPTATATTARLAFNGLYSTSLCPSSNVATTVASIVVLDVEYADNGVITKLAADYKATCTLDRGTPETLAGSLRHNSSTSWLALTPSYAPDVVPLGKQRTRQVTVTATAAGGKTVRLGDAAVSGGRADDYRVSANGCAGKVLGDGESCQVDVVFEPLPVSDGAPHQRIATLDIATTRHVADPLKVRLASTSTKIPGVPSGLTTYPTASGVGITWDAGFPSAEKYRIERSLAGGAWAAVTTLSNAGFYNYVDGEPAPGESVEYRVTGENAGWDGPSATTSTTRPVSVPTAGPNSLVWFGSADATGGDATIRDGVDGGTVTAWGSQAPAIRATAGPTGTGMAPSEVTYRVPFVPGPGEYRSDDRMTGWIQTVDPNLTCSYVDSVLDVRSVAYDENRKPLVFDASWAGHCASGIVARVEVRLGVDTEHNRLSTDPVVVGRLTTYGGRVANGTTTVTNRGPGDVTLGQASLRGDASGDWTITDTTCSGVVLRVGEDCTVAVRFSSTADNKRPAVLEVEQHDATGALAPVYVPLDGFGATVPDAPYGFLSTTIGAVLPWTSEARYDGGLPITSYDLQRRIHGTTSWSALGSTPAGAGAKLSYVDQSAVDGTVYDYRARAVNEVGPGAWNVLGSTNGAETATRALVVSGSTGKSGPRGLFQLSRDSWHAPLIALTDDPAHDYRDPAAAPAGSRLAVSVSTGDGSDGEYDLWSGTLAQPKTQRVTSMAGAERDASYSPDASQIAFTHVAADGARSVWTVPALGGEPQKIRDAAAAPAWTADGTGLVMEDDSAQDAPLLTVDVATGNATAVPGTAGGSEPAVSRGGAIAYVDTYGRVLELAPGATTPKLPFNPQYGRTYGSPVHDDTGRVFYDATWTDTGEPDFANTYLLRVSGEPATVLQDREAPWATPAGLGDFVRGEASFEVKYGDRGETPESALRPECRLDGGPWEPCTGAMSYPDLAEGEHLLVLRLTDEAGHTTSNSVKFVSDTVAPTVRLTAPGTRKILDGTAAFSWDGSDSASGPDWYDVTVRTATPTSGFTKWRLPRGWSSTDQYNALDTPIKVGQELCVRVRVRDLSGLWSGHRTSCVGRPVDDASLNASSGWRRLTMSGLFRGTGTTTSRKGAVLRTSSDVAVQRVGLLATTCPTCGAVKVYVGSKYVGTASLKAAKTRNQRMVMLPPLLEKRTGRVKLVTTSGRAVRIDGLLLRRT